MKTIEVIRINKNDGSRVIATYCNNLSNEENLITDILLERKQNMMEEKFREKVRLSISRNGKIFLVGESEKWDHLVKKD